MFVKLNALIGRENKIMKVSDIEQAIAHLYQDFGEKAGNMSVYLDTRFGNDVIVELGEDTITTLIILPDAEE